MGRLRLPLLLLWWTLLALPCLSVAAVGPPAEEKGGVTGGEPSGSRPAVPRRPNLVTRHSIPVPLEQKRPVARTHTGAIVMPSGKRIARPLYQRQRSTDTALALRHHTRTTPNPTSCLRVDPSQPERTLGDCAPYLHYAHVWVNTTFQAQSPLSPHHQRSYPLGLHDGYEAYMHFVCQSLYLACGSAEQLGLSEMTIVHLSTLTEVVQAEQERHGAIASPLVEDTVRGRTRERGSRPPVSLQRFAEKGLLEMEEKELYVINTCKTACERMRQESAAFVPVDHLPDCQEERYRALTCLDRGHISHFQQAQPMTIVMSPEVARFRRTLRSEIQESLQEEPIERAPSRRPPSRPPTAHPERLQPAYPAPAQANETAPPALFFARAVHRDPSLSRKKCRPLPETASGASLTPRLGPTRVPEGPMTPVVTFTRARLPDPTASSSGNPLTAQRLDALALHVAEEPSFRQYRRSSANSRRSSVSSTSSAHHHHPHHYHPYAQGPTAGSSRQISHSEEPQTQHRYASPHRPRPLSRSGSTGSIASLDSASSSSSSLCSWLPSYLKLTRLGEDSERHRSTFVERAPEHGRDDMDEDGLYLRC